MIAKVNKIALRREAKKKGYRSYKSLAEAMEYNVTYFSRMLNTETENNNQFIQIVADFLECELSVIVENVVDLPSSKTYAESYVDTKMTAIDSLQELFKKDIISKETLQSEINKVLNN